MNIGRLRRNVDPAVAKKAWDNSCKRQSVHMHPRSLPMHQTMRAMENGIVHFDIDDVVQRL